MVASLVGRLVVRRRTEKIGLSLARAGEIGSQKRGEIKFEVETGKVRGKGNVKQKQK